MREILIAGNPNSGKTTVFNALSGMSARVANYPGVTIDRRRAKVTPPKGERVELVDLPGTYSLSARSVEEQIAADAVLGHAGAADVVVLILDATVLARALYLVLQVAETGVPVVLGLNMMDEAQAAGLDIDADALASGLGVTVVPLVASRGEGLSELRAAIETTAAEAPISDWEVPLDEELAADVARVEETDDASRSAKQRRAWALWALLSVGDDELDGIPAEARREVAGVHARADEAGRDVDLSIVSARYARIDELFEEVVRCPDGRRRTWTDRIDGALLHPVLGFLAFAVVMALVFEALFAWSDPAIGLIETLVAAAQNATRAALPDGPIEGLLVDGVIAGVGNVIVFVPQIALLFLFVGFLEDSGYLARVAFVLDRLMGGIGLHGKAFVPMLSGFACAIPAVMATRTIESRRDRLLTMMVVPLTSCSARLPVYVLVTAAVFAPDATVLGFVSIGAAVLFSMYFLSVAAALGAAFVLRRTVLKGKRPALVLELPPYRLPVLRNLIVSTWQRLKSFLVDAGTIILALTIVLWALLSYPQSDAVTARFEAERQSAAQTLSGEALESELAALADAEASEQLRGSFAGTLGRGIEPLIEPLGMDWRLGIGVLGAFAAREVFVSTLGIVFGLGEADEESEPLRSALTSAEWPDGRPLMTPLAGVALMVFFVLACQCMSTIAVVRRESGSWKWPIFMFLYMTVLAYVAALLVYQVGAALGWGLG